MPEITRQDTIRQAIAYIDEASPADLTACLAEAGIHDHLGDNPTELRRLLDAALSTTEGSIYGEWKAAQVILSAAGNRPAGETAVDRRFLDRDYDMRNWSAADLTVYSLVGAIKDLGRDDEPFGVRTDTGTSVRLLGIRRDRDGGIDAGAIELVVSTPEPVVSYADLKALAAGDSPAGQLASVRVIVGSVLESESADRQGALEEIARILAV